MNGVWIGGAPEATTRLGRLSNSNSKKNETRKLEKDKSYKTKDVRVKFMMLFQPSAFFSKHRNNDNPRLRSVRGEINVEI
jgi:hypothetical protein